jgi:hypothetical protein
MLMLTLFSSIEGWGQVSKDSIEIWVKEINAQCININKDSAKMATQQKNIFGQSSEGGILEKYSDGKNLRKAILILFGENGKSTSEYYFLNGKMIFLLEGEVRYKSPVYMGKVEIYSQEENRYYFKYNSLIRWIGGDGKIKDPSLYPDREEDLFAGLKIIQ